MTVDDLYNQVCAMVNTWQRGHLRPNGNFIIYLYEASREMHNNMFDKWETGQRTTDNYARPFLKNINQQISQTPGQPYDTFTYPADYKYFSSARYRLNTAKPGGSLDCNLPICSPDGKIIKVPEQPGYQDPDEMAIAVRDKQDSIKEIKVSKVDNARFGSIMEHRLRAPTLDTLYKNPPILSQFKDGFRVYPKGLLYIQMDYLIQPVKPVYNFTIGSADNIVYNPTGSVQPEWDDALIPEIVARVGQKYAVFIGDQELYKMCAAQISSTE